MALADGTSSSNKLAGIRAGLVMAVQERLILQVRFKSHVPTHCSGNRSAQQYRASSQLVQTKRPLT
jgi:hypothetical protein